MSVVNISKLNLELVSLKLPVKKTDHYQSTMSYTDKKMFIQMSNVLVTNTGNSFNISPTKKQKKCLSELNTRLIQVISENSNIFFGCDLTEAQIQKNYKNIELNDLYTKGSKIFNDHGEMVSLDEISIGDTVTVIVQLKMVFWATTIHCKSDLVQLKKKQNMRELITFLESDSESELEYTSAEDEAVFEKYNQ